MERLGILRELWAFMRARKRWWLAPLVLTLVSVSALLVIAQAATALPFLYPLF